jgi:hypothetical protein
MPLTFVPKGAFNSHFEVWAGTFAIGRISRVALPSGHTREWRWYLTISAAPPGLQREGTAQSVELAKGAAEQCWRAWVEAAGLTERSSPSSGEETEDSKNAPDLS